MSLVLDSVLYNGEKLLWDARFHELAGIANVHVVVEANLTFSGKSKELSFQKDFTGGYSSWCLRPDGDGLKYTTVDGRTILYVPVLDSPPRATSWPMEHFQRNCMLRGLQGFDPMALALVSDCDEIPSAESVRLVQDTLGRGTVAFRQQLSYYHINQLAHDANTGKLEPWHGTKACRLHELQSPQWLRDLPRESCNVVVPNGGWHFSYCGGTRTVQNKLASYAHTEFDKPEYTNAEHIESCAKSGKDLFGRGYRYEVVPLDERFPKYVRENQEKLKELISPCPGNAQNVAAT